MHEDIIGIALERDGRIFPLHPGIERIVQKPIGEHGADTSPLRDPLPALEQGAFLVLHGGL
jgi:hypothetical protein